MSKEPQFRSATDAEASLPQSTDASTAKDNVGPTDDLADPKEVSAGDSAGWHELLEETQQATLDPKMAEVLVNFVRAFPDQEELTLEATAQLVTLILRMKFSRRKLPPECAAWIAEVLYYDPTSHQRVEKLWQLARG